MKKLLKNLLSGGSPKASLERSKTAPPTKRAVWRISDRAPMGEWVDADAAPEPPAAPHKPPRDAKASGWTESSMDLLNGADVVEGVDTAPGELFDEVNARRRASKRG